MTEQIQILVPDIGDFEDVEVIDVLVSVGDRVDAEDPLITLESDKASMDVPTTHAGTIKRVAVEVGAKVSQGSPIAELEPEELALGDATPAASAPSDTATATPPTISQARSASEARVDAEIVVLGSGPGGYTAAFRAADLGKRVVLVERYPTLGGVCLNVGCIPSKALLHAAKVISDAREMADNGIQFGPALIDVDRLRAWKDRVVKQLTDGLAGLSKKRKVQIIEGSGRFIAPNELTVTTNTGEISIGFQQAIIAAGSQAAWIDSLPTDPRIFDSTGALGIESIPKRLLVIGGGIIGLEMAAVYHELGARVTVVEILDSLVTGADADIVKPLERRIRKQYESIYLGTRVTSVAAEPDGLIVSFGGDKAPASDRFDQILVAIGRSANGQRIGAERAGVHVDERGFIAVDQQQRTNVSHIFAIGDIVGQPMLAHKASHEGKVAAEVAAGAKSGFDARVIPSVAYTNPEVAWVGVTEADAKAQSLNYGKGVFPWAASGRSLSLNRSEGVTKLLFDETTKRIIGAGIVGPNAGDLIAEAALAIEMGCDAQDIGLTIHPHPTLSETLGFAAEMFEGTITDLYAPKRN